MALLTTKRRGYQMGKARKRPEHPGARMLYQNDVTGPYGPIEMTERDGGEVTLVQWPPKGGPSQHIAMSRDQMEDLVAIVLEWRAWHEEGEGS